ncbi:MAG: TIGR03088 family PEP-CTERM/XrtA system glycosyltransferase [Hyphomicrobiales bacterium]
MRILHVINTLRVGGLENGVVNLINHMDAARFHHDICCLTVSGPLAARIRDRDVAVHELHKGPGQDWSVYGRLVALLRRVRPDIVHTRNWSTLDLVAAARWAGVPAVVHGEHGWNADDVRGTRRKSILLRRALAPFIDRWIAVSGDIQRWLVGTIRVPERKVVTIRNGVDTERFRPRATGRDPGARGDGAVVIGTVGRLDPIKAQGDLIAACAALHRAGKPVRLVIVGDGPMRGALEAERNRLGPGVAVELDGEVARPEDAYARFDVFALPSLNEGISNTILESMACGLPIVASRVGGNPELVRDGDTGTLVPPSDVGALAAALGRYVDDDALRERHGAAARRRAVEEFSLERMTRTYEATYTEVHRARGGRSVGNGRGPSGAGP